MDFLIAAQGVRNRGAIPRERGRVEDDEVPTRDDFLVRLYCGLSFEPIEYVNRLKRTLFGLAVGSCVSGSGSDGIGALVQEMDLRSTGARRMGL